MAKYKVQATVDGVSFEALLNKHGGVEGAKRFLRGEVVITEKPPLTLLEHVSTTDPLPACPRFTVGELFDAPGIWVSDRFREVFSGKVENGIPTTAYRIHELTRRSRDGVNEDGSPGILYELKDHKEFYLCHLEAFLKGQTWNWLIFYIRDKEGKLWAVGARRDGDDWGLSVYSTEYPDHWSAGRHVVSCEDA